MKKSLLIVLLITFTTICSGCIAVLAGAGGYCAVKAMTTRYPKLTEMQRRALECKEIEGKREDVLRAAVTVFQDRGYFVKSSDYQGGIITAEAGKPVLNVTASIEEFTSDRINMRVTIKDKDGVIEDPKVFAKLFEDIQAEVFRRINLSK